LRRGFGPDEGMPAGFKRRETVKERPMEAEPVLIQGGMGTAVSNWRLARAVSQTGQLGVVSGTALDGVMARRLQVGDGDGAMRRALGRFPNHAMAERILEKYFIPGGKGPLEPFRPVPMFSLRPPRELLELTVAANFAEVSLAKEGHEGRVGINLLEKIQMPTLPSLYGAMLAGVDYVLIGAGIPRSIPGILDEMALNHPVSLKMNVQGAGPQDDYRMLFDPQELMGKPLKRMRRPKFIAIVSSAVLAATLAKKSSGRVDGFVVEGPTAGGHNAPPRGALRLSPGGEPVYGPRDEADLEEIRALGLPFWLAGSCASPEKLRNALRSGAAGVQVGTIFAYCRESGLTEEIKRKVRQGIESGKAEVFTDPAASPTGFPFKVVRLEGTLSEEREYRRRPRVCDLGYLRNLFKKRDGTVGYRCPGEPEKLFLQKGGAPDAAPGKKCLCNGLMANIGLGQVQKEAYEEKALVTSGDDLARIPFFQKGFPATYSAADVVRYLLGSPAGDAPVSV
jgi:nitronate monooxygenase